jgi:hypothetical protein
VRIPLAILAAAVVFTVAAPPASAEIVVNRSIAGVSLGMSQDEVLDLLGSPNRTVTNRAFDTTYTYRSRGIQVVFAPNGSTNDVTTVVVRGRAERTASGVGVGSTLGALRRGVTGERCVRAPNRRHRWCSVRSRGRHTTFVITSTKRVHQIVFGFYENA